MSASATGASGAVGATYFSAFVEGRRGAILDAALQVCAAKGYEGGTMREVAALLGVTEPALYRHYASKEALYGDLVARAGDHIIETVARGMARIRPENLRASLVEVLCSRRREGHSMSSMMGMMLMSSPHNTALLEAFRTHMALPMAAQVRGLVPRVDAFFGIERTGAELDWAVRAFMSIVAGFSMTAITLGADDADEAAVDTILAVLGWKPEAHA
jgi:AcrR family transcriptional regulator